MRFQTLPVKRRPAAKGILRRLSAVTRSRKQRVAAANPADVEMDDDGSKIARALIIIFLVHIVIVGLVFVQKNFLAGRPAEAAESAKVGSAEVTAVAAAAAVVPPHAATPEPVAAEKVYPAKAGDTYARIASAKGVDEGALRLLNKHVDIVPGLIIQLPPSRAATTVATSLHSPAATDHDRGLVEATPVDVSGAPKARAAKTNGSADAPAHAATSSQAATGKSYVVQSGDSIWRISHRSKVSQEAILKANGISDARKIKPGMKLIIPHV